MVDHDDVGFQCAAPGLEQRAAAEMRTTLAETVLARRTDLRAQRMSFSEFGQLGQIAAARHRRPVADARQQRVGGGRQQIALPSDVLEPGPAQIVAAAFEQRNPGGSSEGCRQQRQVAMKQLILQSARASRNQHAQSRQQRRHQVRECLACAGARLDQQVFALLQRLADARRHALLRTAGAKARQGARQWTVGAEYRGKIGHHRIMQPVLECKNPAFWAPPV